MVNETEAHTDLDLLILNHTSKGLKPKVKQRETKTDKLQLISFL